MMSAVYVVDQFNLADSIVATGRQDAEGAVKVWEDLDRYRSVVAADQPEVIVETGTHLGGSARWFAALGVDVVSIDTLQRNLDRQSRVRWLIGNSIDPNVVDEVRQLVADRRTMVVLDSDHSADHVRAEIAAYGPLVTVGCHLVVEDGIARFMDGHSGDPLVAIENTLIDDPDWVRDVDTESMHPVTMYPAGWWIRAR